MFFLSFELLFLIFFKDDGAKNTFSLGNVQDINEHLTIDEDVVMTLGQTNKNSLIEADQLGK